MGKIFPPLLFRCDADSRMGTGHAMRCLALAKAWQDEGGKGVFLGSWNAEQIIRRIEREGLGVIPLRDPHPHPLDLECTLKELEALSGFGDFPPWLILDGYHFDPDYQRAVRAQGYRLLVVDDMRHHPEYHADILLNQNLHAEKLSYPCNPEAMLLMGPRYALLRPEFLYWRTRERIIPDVGRKVLVTLGGADPENATLKAICALGSLRKLGLHVRIVAGPANPNFSSLQGELPSLGPGAELLTGVENVPELMAWADLAIAGGGISCFELAFLRVPTLVLILSENQAPVGEALGDLGAAVNLGWHNRVESRDMAEKIAWLCQDKAARLKLSQTIGSIVDGLGARRVAAFIRASSSLEEGALRIRRAVPDDAVQIWRLANDATVRKNSFHPDPIPLDAHLGWYSRKLSSPESRIWVLEIEGTIVGQLRCDKIESDVAEIDFSVAPAFRGKGLGTRLLNLALRHAPKEMGISLLRGVVFFHNDASARAFLKAGFKKVEEGLKGEYSYHVFEQKVS